MTEQRLDVVGFGALNLDVIYRVGSVEEAGLEPGSEAVGAPDGHRALEHRLARVGPPTAVSPGGSAANTVFALARMGYRTGYVGAVGEEPEAALLLDGLGARVDMCVARRGSSGRAVIAVDPDGEQSISVFPNANDTLAEADVDHALLARARAVHMTSFVGDAPLRAQSEAARRLPEGVVLTFDPGALCSRRGIKALGHILERTDVLLATEDELLELTDESDRERAVRRVRATGAGVVVCKLGGRGMHVYWEGHDHLHRAHPVKVAGDAVGAGDVAAAGFIAGSLEGLRPDQCAAVAHGCAVESLAGHGRTSYPDRRVLWRLVEAQLSAQGGE